jgi:hypothetical protein
MRRSVIWILMLALPIAAQAGERYQQASIDARGRLRIAVAGGGERLPKKLHGQAGFDSAAVSIDGSRVGWLALYPNCCTSYPVALALVLYRNGGIRRVFTGNGLAFSIWHFAANGRQVAFEQETVHGHRGVHYELRDIASGRLLGHYEGDPAVNAPRWVRELTPSPIAAPDAGAAQYHE